MSDADVSSFLLGPVLGILLRLKGLTCLHASAVALRGRVIIFTGAEGAGKSTTAAVFARHGHAALTDDIAALELVNRTLTVRPGYPALNLFSDSVQLLLGSPNTLPEPDPAVEKQQMLLEGGGTCFQSEPLPLGVVFILDDDPADSTQTRVEALTPRNALLALASHTYANKMLDTEMRAAEFRTLGTLVSSVPVLRLIGLSATPDLEKLCQLIGDAATSAMEIQTCANTT